MAEPEDKTDLAEVERALSVLKGRHPDHVRAERETREEIESRRRALDQEARGERRRTLQRWAMVVLAIAALIAGLRWVGQRNVLAEARARSLEGPLAPYLAAGFRPVPGTGVSTLFPWSRTDRLEVDLEAGTCAVAVAASGRGPAPLTVERDGSSTAGLATLAWCSCAKERVAVTVTMGDPETRAVSLVRTDAARFAGVHGFARARLAPSAVADSPCVEDHLDAWLAMHPAEPVDAEWLAERPARKVLTAAGFQPVVTVKPDRAFAPLTIPAESCALMLPSEAGPGQDDPTRDTLTLRLPGGQRIRGAGGQSLSACVREPLTVSLWREGSGPAHALVVGARRIGGLLGTREASERIGTRTAQGWVTDVNLAWDALQTLLASGVPQAASVDFTSQQRPTVHDARIMALSLGEGSRVLPDTTHDLAFYGCVPELEKSRQTVCVQASPQRWRDTSPKGRGGGAEAELPYWLTSLAATHDAAAARVELSLLRLARRLKAEGFDPTVLESTVELPAGVEVHGRAGEDAVVAIALQPLPPFAIPCTDGPTWSIDGDPRVVELAPAARVRLRPLVPVAIPRESRRTVIFRRTVK